MANRTSNRAIRRVFMSRGESIRCSNHYRLYASWTWKRPTGFTFKVRSKLTAAQSRAAKRRLNQMVEWERGE